MAKGRNRECLRSGRGRGERERKTTERNQEKKKEERGEIHKARVVRVGRRRSSFSRKTEVQIFARRAASRETGETILLILIKINKKNNSETS